MSKIFSLLQSFVTGLIFIFTANAVMAEQVDQNKQTEPTLYVVNFTAEWCPNCKVLDPALERALEGINTDHVQHFEFNMTDSLRSEETFHKVNGTVLAGVYGDYLGVTGLVVMIAADSGEKIDCATRLVSAEAIKASIYNSLEIVRNNPAGTRETTSILCPPSNRKVIIPA